MSSSRNADVVVTSYSTAGDEAIALGCPVVCYAGLRPSMSSFLDIPAAPVVHDAGELLAALERMIDDPEYLEAYRSRWPDLIEGSFHRLDAQASHRMLAALLGPSFHATDAGGASTGQDMSVLTSIIIRTLNEAKHLEKLLKGIHEQKLLGLGKSWLVGLWLYRWDPWT